MPALIDIEASAHAGFAAGDIAAPDVSFCIAAYNVAPYIEAAVRSALDQTGVSVEVVVVDHSSTDDTGRIVEAMSRADARVVVSRLPFGGGPGASRNAAMTRARGAWLAVLDGDDTVAPGRSRRLLDLAAATSADLVADNFERVTHDGAPTGSTMMPLAPHPYALHVDTAAFIAGNTASARPQRSLGAVKTMFRRDFVRAHELRHQADIIVGEDYHLILDCLLAGARFIVCSDATYFYRQRPGSVSWRLSAAHIERLLSQHETLRLEHDTLGGPAVPAAARAYRQALEGWREFTQCVTLAKGGRWLESLSHAAAHPGAWPLIRRHGGEAILKRLARKSIANRAVQPRRRSETDGVQAG